MAIDYRTRYQNLGKSDWFNKHYNNKSVSVEEVKDWQTNNDEKTMIFKGLRCFCTEIILFWMRKS